MQSFSSKENLNHRIYTRVVALEPDLYRTSHYSLTGSLFGGVSIQLYHSRHVQAVVLSALSTY